LPSVAFLAVSLTPLRSAHSRASPGRRFPIPKLHEFKPQQPKRIELKNGIVIFLAGRSRVAVCFRVGADSRWRSRDEDPAKAGLVGPLRPGLAHQRHRKDERRRHGRPAGGQGGAHRDRGDEDSTALAWDSLKGDSDQVFALALDLLFHPKFNAEKLQLAQQQEATGIVRRNDDESGDCRPRGAKLVYGANSPYTRQPELAPLARSRWRFDRPGTTARWAAS
jgi:zinc protease